MEPKQKESAEPPSDFEGEPRLIAPADWKSQRWGWLEAVRHDVNINPMARLVAHELALGFANADTARCDPSIGDLASVLGASKDTIDRAVRALVKAKWIVKLAGRGRGNNTRFGFLTRAKVVALKGGKYAPLKGGKSAPFYGGGAGAQKGANMPLKGGKYAPPLYKDKPYKNHKSAASVAKCSENPLVIQDAERAVSAFRDGSKRAFEGMPKWVWDHIIAAGLLSDVERDEIGLS